MKYFFEFIYDIVSQNIYWFPLYMLGMKMKNHKSKIWKTILLKYNKISKF